MPQAPKRCMVCGKVAEDGATICRACNDSIRGEATGQRKKLVKQAEKEIKQQGGSCPASTQTPGNKG